MKTAFVSKQLSLMCLKSKNVENTRAFEVSLKGVEIDKNKLLKSLIFFVAGKTHFQGKPLKSCDTFEGQAKQEIRCKLICTSANVFVLNSGLQVS